MRLLLYRKDPEVSLRGDLQLAVTLLVQLSFVERSVKPKPVIRRRSWLLMILISPTLALVETSTMILSRPNTSYFAIGIYPRRDLFDGLRRQRRRNEDTTVAWQCAHTHVRRASASVLGRVKPSVFLWTSSYSRPSFMHVALCWVILAHIMWHSWRMWTGLQLSDPQPSIMVVWHVRRVDVK